MKPSPPRWPGRLLEMLCDPELIDEITGDLDEMFTIWVRTHGVKKAGWLYIWHTVKFIRPFIFKRRKSMKNSSSIEIVFSLVRTSWRNVNRHKAFAVINVVGLMLSFTCIILIYALCAFHLRFDNFHPDTERIFRVITEFKSSDRALWPVVPQPLGKAIRNDLTFPEITARIRYYRLATVTLPDMPGVPHFQEDNLVAFAEPEYFRIFDYPGLPDPIKAKLRDPNTAIITKKMATKYFGDADAVDRTIRVSSRDQHVDFRIIGVLDDIRPNTDMRAQIFLSYENLKNYDAYYASDKSWGSVNGGMFCFVKLKKGATAADMNAAFPDLVKKYYQADEAGMNNFTLQPLADLHLDTRLGGSFSRKYVWILGAIGFFLLAIASVNFINLASAQVLSRAREAGIRKVLGSLASHLYIQFIVETAIIGLLALVLAIAAAYTGVPILNETLKTGLAIGEINYVEVSLVAAAIACVVILIAGSYPALVISKFKPVNVLKGKLLRGDVSGISLRRTLIVLQFAIAQVLIIGMIVIGDQVRYSTSSDLGFDKEAVVLLPIPENNVTKMKTVSTQLAQVPGVRETSLCYEPPASHFNTYTSVVFDNHEKEEPWEINLKEGDDHFVTTFGLSLIAGRNLVPSDSVREFLVNETFIHKVGFDHPQDAIGKTISVNGNTLKGAIVGVVKDFYDQSLHDQIMPICIMPNYERFRTVAVKLELRGATSVVEQLRELWTHIYSESVFNFQFFDQNVERFYETETAMLRLVEAFAVIAIVVSCLGLYGLVSFMAIQRTKEISIRKVLGANIRSVLWSFGREFVLLISGAFLVAAPVAGWLMNNWLQGFAYHLPLGSSAFLFALAGTLIVAVVTVSYHSMRAATANPMDALRAE